MQSWLERVFVLSTLILEIIKSRRNNFKSRATNHVYFKCLHIAGGANKHQVLKPSKRKPIRNKKKKKGLLGKIVRKQDIRQLVSYRG